jgi:hypothetical protein
MEGFPNAGDRVLFQPEWDAMSVNFLLLLAKVKNNGRGWG